MAKRPNAAAKQHMERVASLGCIICQGEAEVHHLLHQKGMGRRNSHFETIPLCFPHHRGEDGIHTIGRRKWEARYGTELELLERTRAQLADAGDTRFPFTQQTGERNDRD